MACLHVFVTVCVSFNGTSVMFLWCMTENEDMPVYMFNMRVYLHTHTCVYFPLHANAGSGVGS